jgi:uncharacterized protein YbjT (DUF2867 family)
MNVLIGAPAGYVGRQLLLRFEREMGVALRVLIDDARRIAGDLGARTEVVEGNLLEPAVLRDAVRSIDVAYYPLRLASPDRDFASRNREFAHRFRDACIEAGVKRIVHLGTPAVRAKPSRLQTIFLEAAEILGARPDRIQLLCLSPGVIIGPGSAVYEMVMNLVRKAPLLFVPRWARAEVRPVALSDMVEYLARAASLEVTGNLSIDIGRPGIRVGDLLALAMRVTGRSRTTIPLPVSLPRLSALLVTLATPFSYRVSLELVRYLRAAPGTLPGPSPPDATRYFPEVTPLTCEQAMTMALAATDADEVESRWTDSIVGISYRPSEGEMRAARYQVVEQQDFGNLSASKVYRSVLSVGGEAGWFSFDILWRIRGFLDKLLGGFGTSLGRRSATELRTGDMLDVWRVVDLVENERVLLEAQMEVFGKAWLEFRLRGTTLSQTAYYDPAGPAGRLYWYAMLPFHRFIFPDMIRSIIDRAAEL